jgi:hypothetical protein
MYPQYNNNNNNNTDEYRIFKPVEVTIRRGLRLKGEK